MTACICCILSTRSAYAQWTQWGGGPQHDFCIPDADLADAWPESGPKMLWKRNIGGGHSSILCDDGKLYTMCRRGEQDVVLAMDAASGRILWETTYDSPMKPGMLLDFGPGPHSTPLIVNDRIYTISACVLFHCLDRATGKILWKKDLMEEYGASNLQRGYGASPVPYKDTVIVNVGGKDIGLAAFRQDNGELVWKTDAGRPGYPTPLIVQINGRDMLIAASGVTRRGLDPATGEEYWRLQVDTQCASMMSTPMWIPPDRVFLTSAYGGGSRVIRITPDGDGFRAEEVWHNRKMKIQHGTFARIDDYIYGTSGDFGPAFLMATDVNTGDVLWRERGLPKCSVLHAGDKLILLDERGKLMLANATPKGVTFLAEAQMLEEKAWTVPTLIGTKLYMRDNKTIMALDLGREANG
jgi:outer membrane protein assembly factor BamB